MPKKETFTSRFEETRRGRLPPNLKFGETLFMDGPLDYVRLFNSSLV